MQATSWQSPAGTKIGSYIVHFANGENREVPIVYGKNVLDWWAQAGDELGDGGERVWTGKNTTGPDAPPVSVFKLTWQNALPDEVIESIDFKSAMAESAPFLIALTVE